MKLIDLLIAGYAALKIVSKTDKGAAKSLKLYEEKIKQLKANQDEKDKHKKTIT